MILGPGTEAISGHQAGRSPSKIQMREEIPEMLEEQQAAMSRQAGPGSCFGPGPCLVAGSCTV